MKGVTLEEILQEYFGCAKPFCKNGTFTYRGAKAYNKLISLVSNVCDLCSAQRFGRPSINLPKDEIISVLDDITEEDF